VNIKELGAKGDGETDDTKAFQDAIAKYPTIYVPQGFYRITETVKMAPGTKLIGLHPWGTQLILKESEAAFSGFGGPKPILESSEGGDDMLNGIGLSPGGYNYRAVACKWMAGKNSYMNDVKFVGGHGAVTRRPAAQSPSSDRQTGVPAQPGASNRQTGAHPQQLTDKQVLQLLRLATDKAVVVVSGGKEPSVHHPTRLQDRVLTLHGTISTGACGLPKMEVVPLRIYGQPTHMQQLDYMSATLLLPAVSMLFLLSTTCVMKPVLKTYQTGNCTLSSSRKRAVKVKSVRWSNYRTAKI
jgi:hypothetical protein